MRVTLLPVGDVEVPDGSTLGECRPLLAALTADPTLVDAPLGVDGYLLGDDQVAGVAPWVAGAVLHRGPGPRDPAVLAARSGWHLAVVAGPDAGLVAVADRGVLVVGRTGGAPGRLTLSDPAVSRRHLTVRAGARPGRWSVRDQGSANGTRHAPATGSRVARVARRRSRRMRVGDRLLVGATTIELRVAPPVQVGRDRSRPGPDAGGAPGSVPHQGHGQSWALALPLVSAAALVAVTRSPIALVLALGALAPAIGALSGRVRRRRSALRPAPTALADDPAAVVVRLAAGDGAPPTTGATAPVQPWLELASDGLAVVGARGPALGCVRALLGAALADGSLIPAPPGEGPPPVALLTRPDDDARWSWARWLPRTVAPPDAGSPDGALGAPSAPRLVVVDGLERWHGPLQRHRAGRATPGPAMLLLLPAGTAAPAWCRWVLRVADDGTSVLDGPGGPRTAASLAAGEGWLEDVARRVAGRPAWAGDPPTLPARVALAELGLPATTAAVAAAWTSVRAAGPVTSLRATLGHDGAPVDLDLVAHGPHTLVAGTTGSGKSELLTALVLALAARYPPDLLALVLIDFKGGAGLRGCAGLPHVVGSVSDLDAAEAGRALAGLRAELRRRARLLAEHGVGDLEQLRALGLPTPPRVVVVVDEFRALGEDLPDLVGRLVRVAAQGRSLGLHLVLATQRPAGAVDAELRANVTSRVCLRVADAQDSLDVLDVADAARLPVDLPGRALRRTGSGPVEALQVAWPAYRQPATGSAGAVRWAAPWSAGTRPDAAPGARIGPGGPDQPDGTVGPGGPGGDPVASLVAAVVAAAAALPRPEPLWVPALPARLAPHEVPTDPRPGVLTLGLSDDPERQHRGPAGWDPRSGPLLVAGRPGSGRTGALRAVATAASAAGWHLHLVTGRTSVAPPHDQRLGTVVDARDPRRVARLLDLLAAGTEHPTLLVVDDVSLVRRALGTLPGSAVDPLDAAGRAATSGRLALAVAGLPGDLTRLLPGAGARLVLAVADEHDDLLLGVPRALAGGRAVPGRAVLVAGRHAERCQVTAVDGWLGPATAGAPPLAPPVRLAPVPTRVSRAELATVVASAAAAPRAPTPTAGGLRRGAGRGAGSRPWPDLALGLGADDGGPVATSVERGLLVVGPPGSGRSTALRTLLAVVGADAAVVRLGRELSGAAPWATPGTAPGTASGCRPVGGLADAVRHAAATGARLLVVDDLDLLLRSDPATDDLLAGWVAAAEAGEEVPRLVASARTDRAAGAFRGALAALRSTAPVLVLAPTAPGSADVAGADLRTCLDPGAARLPGRGALVTGGLALPVQVAGD